MTRRGKENSRRIDLLEDRTTQDQLMGLRHGNISQTETRSIHLKEWSEIDDEDSLGRQQFYPLEGGEWLSS